MSSRTVLESQQSAIAPAAGRVTAILVGNGQPVEYDQPLVVVE